MTCNDLKSAFSIAWVRAIAHAAGYFAQEANRDRDHDGVDVELFARDRRGTVRSPSVNLQVKATAATPIGDPIPYDLDIKNYDELRDTSFQVPRILVVVFVPDDQQQWLQCSENELILRRAGYWRSLTDQPATENLATIRVHLPRANLFDIPNVKSILDRIRQGQQP